MSIKGELSIVRPSCSDGKKYIRIMVGDVEARIQFLDIEIALDDFAECLTGLSFVKCDINVRGAEKIGKRIESDELIFEMPSRVKYSERNQVAAELARESTPDGWEASDYFCAQDSFFEKDGKSYARTSISRWV
jgi:hypothetical protein